MRQEGGWHCRTSASPSRCTGPIDRPGAFRHRHHRNRSHAEDIVQEAWIRIEQAERTQALQQPLYYFYRIVRNFALDGRRRIAVEDRYFERGADRAANEVAEDRPSAEAAR